MKAVLSRSGLDGARVDDVVFAQSYANSETPCVGRWIALQAGLPVGVPGMQLDRRCGGGLQAVATAAMMVQSGAADAVIATHTVPESCVVCREAQREALTEARVDQPLSRESDYLQGADAVSDAEGNMDRRVIASVGPAVLRKNSINTDLTRVERRAPNRAMIGACSCVNFA